MGIVGLFILGLVGGVILVLLPKRVTCVVCGSTLLNMLCHVFGIGVGVDG